MLCARSAVLSKTRMPGDWEGDSPGASSDDRQIPPAMGRFWALASDDSDEDEGSTAAPDRSFGHWCATPVSEELISLCEKRRSKREAKIKRQRWAAKVLRDSSPVRFSSPFSQVSSGRRSTSSSVDLSNVRLPMMSPTVTALSDEYDAVSWTLVRSKRCSRKKNAIADAAVTTLPVVFSGEIQSRFF